VPMNENQIRELITSWGKENLSIVQRTVDVNGIAQAAITSADWHSAATNKMVAGPGGAPGQDQDNSKLRHFRMLMAGGYNSVSQQSAEFVSLVDLFQEAIGKDLTGKSASSICALACAWHRQICPRAEFDDYVPGAHAAGEIAALSPNGNNATNEIFKHRFTRSWRKVYPNISQSFSTATSGEEAYHLAETLAARFKLSTPLSAATASALELLLAKVLPAIDTDGLKLKSNNERLAALSEGDIQASTGRAAGEGSGTNTAGGDNAHRMYTDPKYIKLQSAVEALALPGYDVITAFKTMTMHEHPFGLLYINGMRMSKHPVWCFFSGLQNYTVAREALLSMLRIDKLGVEHKEWVLDVHTDVAKKLLTGSFAMGDGKAGSIHYYSQIIRPCLEKKEGFHMTTRYAKYEKLTSGAIFLDPQLMRFAEQILGTCFDFIGHNGKHALTFRALWRGMIERAQVLETLPNSAPVVQALKNKLVEVGTHSFASAAEDMASLCTTALGVLVRPSGFFRNNSKGSIALIAYDSLLQQVMVDIERAQFGMGRIPGMPGCSELVNQLMTGVSENPGQESSTQLTIRGRKRGRSDIASVETEVETNGRGWDQAFDTNKNGDQAAYHGIWLSDAGYVFGWNKVGLRDGVTQNISGVCPGQLALSKHPYKRAGWHVAGFNCVKEHPRPGNLKDEDIVELTSAANPLTPDMRAKLKVVVAPFAGNSSAARYSSEKPTHGDGGKGSKGGKGKGKGKGKNGGKGGKQLNRRQR
jgi:hypothetical protein